MPKQGDITEWTLMAPALGKPAAIAQYGLNAKSRAIQANFRFFATLND